MESSIPIINGRPVAALLLMVTFTAHGQGATGVPLESGSSMPISAAASLPVPPGGIPLGPLIVYPGIDVSIGHNDNLFSSSINKRSSTQTTVSPNAKVESRFGAHRFEAAFRIDDVRFSSSPADNFSAYSIAGSADLAFSGRAGLKARAEHRRGVDPRGSTDRVVASSPDEYVNQGIEGIFGYGAPGARGRIEVDGAAYSKRYQNNRLSTAASDRDTTQIGGTFFYRIAPKTEVLGLVQRRSIDYATDTSTQSSTETRYQVGAKWEATAKTTGIVKYGLLDKRFNDSGRTDFSGSSWDAIVRWSPLTYSIFDFSTNKGSNESTGTGDFLLTQVYGVNWNHAWNSRFSSVAVANWRKDEFLGTGGGRIDKTSTFGLTLNYQWQRWLRLGASYTLTDRVSNPDTFDFTRHLWMFTVGATL